MYGFLKPEKNKSTKTSKVKNGHQRGTEKPEEVAHNSNGPSQNLHACESRQESQRTRERERDVVFSRLKNDARKPLVNLKIKLMHTAK